MLNTLGKLPFAAAEPLGSTKGFLGQAKGLLAGAARSQATASFPGRRSADLARLAAVQAQAVATIDAAQGVAARRQAACDLQVCCGPQGALARPARRQQSFAVPMSRL